MNIPYNNKVNNTIYKGIKIKFKSISLLILLFNLKVINIKNINNEKPIIFEAIILKKFPVLIEPLFEFSVLSIKSFI